MAYRRNAVFRATLKVQRSHVGFLVGARGATIKGLQKKHGIRSHIDQTTLEYKLSGPEPNVRDAIADIKKHVEWIKNLQPRSQPEPVKRTVKNEVDEDGFTTIRSSGRRPTRKTVAPIQLETTNKYAGFDSDSDDEEEDTQESKPRVTFAHDATGEDEIRRFDKNDPPSAVSSPTNSDNEPSADDLAYLASKTSTSNAWRPRRARTSSIRDLRNDMDNLTPAEMVESLSKRKKTRTQKSKSWADIADEWDELNDELIVTGRP